jgi:hypothetical protein
MTLLRILARLFLMPIGLTLSWATFLKSGTVWMESHTT